jgi:hypothetical protein
VSREPVHLPLTLSIVLIIIGGVSLLYGFMIPVTYLPMNILPSMIFKIIGVMFIFIGFISMLVQLRRKKSQKIDTENEIRTV